MVSAEVERGREQQTGKISFSKDLLSKCLKPDQVESVWTGTSRYWSDLRQLDGGIMASHSERTAFISRTIGEIYGIEGQELDKLTLAGMMHDIGKSKRYPDGSFKYSWAFCTREGYGPEKRKQMAEHAEDGYEILRSVGMPPEIAEVARDHQLVYIRPISLFTKIVAIADWFDAETDPRRIHKKKLEPQEVYDEIDNLLIPHLKNPKLTEAYRRWGEMKLFRK